jgi:hypothetical protein
VAAGYALPLGTKLRIIGSNRVRADGLADDATLPPDGGGGFR